jgi:anti-anti-sigma factor
MTRFHTIAVVPAYRLDGFRFACPVHHDGRVGHVVPEGDLDIATAPIVDGRLSELRAGGCRALVLELRELTFIDLAGLHLAERWTALAQNDAFTFELIPGPPAVQRLFDVTHTLATLPFRAAPDTAVSR